MRQVKIKDDFFQKCVLHGTQGELMYNEFGRPCVLILNLKYKGQMHKFVVPMRSNISPKTPRSQYFSLPPNSNTKPYHSHGIHYIKLFPITDEYVDTYMISSTYDISVKNIIDANDHEITAACQDYLYECENGKKHYMTPDIDGILNWLYSEQTPVVTNAPELTPC